MNCMVVTGGNAPPGRLLKEIRSKCQYTIAADSGIEVCIRSGIEPDLVIGDFDSLSNRNMLDLVEKERISMHPKDKGHTDTELALLTAYKMDFEKIILAGGGGGRLDHLLGIYSAFMRERVPSEWHTDNESCILIDKEYKGKFTIGKRISFFPVSEGETRMKSLGLKWPLDGLEWRYGSAGISNVTVAESISITMIKGRLLMIYDHHSKDRQ